MELADLRRRMRKNDFLEPEKLFFAKLGWSEFHEISVQKQFFGARKIVFLQSVVSVNFVAYSS